MNVRGRGLPMVLATGCEIEYSGNGNEVTARLFNRLPEGIVTSDSVAVSKDRGPRTRIEVRNLVMKGHLVGVLEIEGEIDVYSLSLLKEQARNLLDRGINHILIDVESLDYIDSSGLGFFVGTQQLCQNLGGCLVIAKPTSYIQRLFGTILSEKIVPVIYSEQELENFLSDSTI